MWARLDEKYGAIGKLIDSILFQIKSLPLENSESQATLNMIKVVEKAYRDLQRLNRAEEMHNGTTISLIEEKLPFNIRQEWVKLVAGKHKLTSAEKFTMLLELLTEWRCRLEYDSDSIRLIPVQDGTVMHINQPPQNYQRYSGPSGNNGGNQNGPRRAKCWLHESRGGNADHPIWRCRDFASRQVHERIQLVVLNKACQVCLVQNCPGLTAPTNCPTGFTCKEIGCGLNHNKLLHVNQPQQQQLQQQQQQQRDNRTNPGHLPPALPIQPL